MEQTILGLPIAQELPVSGDYTLSPYSAVAVLKGFDSDGDEFYAVVTTENMTPVDAAGLIRYASLYADELMRKSIVATTEQSSQE